MTKCRDLPELQKVIGQLQAVSTPPSSYGLVCKYFLNEHDGESCSECPLCSDTTGRRCILSKWRYEAETILDKLEKMNKLNGD